MRCPPIPGFDEVFALPYSSAPALRLLRRQSILSLCLNVGVPQVRPIRPSPSCAQEFEPHIRLADEDLRHVPPVEIQIPNDKLYPPLQNPLFEPSLRRVSVFLLAFGSVDIGHTHFEPTVPKRSDVQRVSVTHVDNVGEQHRRHTDAADEEKGNDDARGQEEGSKRLVSNELDGGFKHGVFLGFAGFGGELLEKLRDWSWHNSLARGKYACEHPITSSLLETGGC